MTKLTKIAQVLGGYILACLIAYGVVFVYQLLTQNNPVVQGSSGMYAFGDLMLFIGVFVTLALFPTGLALYFLLVKLRKGSA